MGDDASICIVADATDNGGGTNVPSVLPSSIIPRCILAVRLSDAFCFRITSRLWCDVYRLSLSGMARCDEYAGFVIRVPWNDDDDRDMASDGIVDNNVTSSATTAE